MGVYSPNMLMHFPEQFIKVPYFDMQPLINDNYGSRENQVNINCIVQNLGSGVKDSNGHIVRNSRNYLWSTRELTPGKFVEWNSRVFRLVVDNDWVREGGFYNYSMEKLVGSDGTVDATDYGADIGGTPI